MFDIKKSYHIIKHIIHICFTLRIIALTLYNMCLYLIINYTSAGTL